MAIVWELRPDLAFFVANGAGMIQASESWSDVVSAMSNTSLKEEITNVEITEQPRSIGFGPEIGERSPLIGLLQSYLMLSGEEETHQVPASPICSTCHRELTNGVCSHCKPSQQVAKNLTPVFNSVEATPFISPAQQKYEGTHSKWTCKCGKVNDSTDISTCPGCNQKRTEQPASPADTEKWTCVKCITVNDATFKYCKTCSRLRRPVTAAKESVAASSNPPAPSRGSLPTQLETWMCLSCGFANSKYVQTCLQCQQRKRTEPEARSSLDPERILQCPKCGSRLNGASECSICKGTSNVRLNFSTLMPAEERKTGIGLKWTCTKCGEMLNFSSDKTCSLCGKARDATIEATWKCDACKGINMSIDSICAYCSMRRITPAKPDVTKLSSKWTCLICHFVNEELRVFCSQCHKIKSLSQEYAGSGIPQPKAAFQTEVPAWAHTGSTPKRKCECGAVLMDSEQKCGACEAKTISPYSYSGKEWICEKCGTGNRATRETCQQCFKQKSIRTTPAKCLKCNRSAEAGEILCSICKHQEISPRQSSSWRCKICKTLNLQDSERCLICKSQRT